MKKVNTSLINARMMENEALIKNALHYEKMLAEGNSPEQIINKAKQYLGLDENTPVLGFWEPIQREYNVKTNTFIKANSLLNSLSKIDHEVTDDLILKLEELAKSLEPDVMEVYELEEDDLYIYETEEL